MEKVMSETVRATSSARPSRFRVKASMVGPAGLPLPACGERVRVRGGALQRAGVCQCPSPRPSPHAEEVWGEGEELHFHFAAKNCGTSSDVGVKTRSLE